MSSTNIMEDIAVEAQSDQPIKHEVEVVIPPPLTSDERSQSGRIKEHVKLCLLAAMEDNWDKAKELYDNYADDISAVFSKQKNKALDFTADADRTDFVKSLIDYLNVENLSALKNAYGCTAFYWAAASGDSELVDMMMNKKNGKQLTNIPGFDNISLALTRQSSPTKKKGKRKDNISRLSTLQGSPTNEEAGEEKDNIWPHHGILPLQAAAMSSHREMILRLYDETHLEDKRDRVELLVTLIKIDSYDVALKLIDTFDRELATARDRNGETALHVLAGKSMSSSKQQGILQRFFGFFPSIKSGSNKSQAQQALKDLVERIWSHVVVCDDVKISKLISYPFRLIFHAARKENMEFLRKLADKRPDILWEVDERKQTIFHVAAYNRQEKIIKVLSEMRPKNDPRVFLADKNGNTILHLAAMVQGNDVDGSKSSNEGSNNDGSHVIFGTAFQLPERLRWFKKVSEILPPVIAEARNNYSQTPRDLFYKAHGNLTKDNQKWMKETANSCMVVATLVATVAFAAAFAIPGGNKGDTGVPVFVEEVSFKVFAISDAVALVFSTISVLTFLFIYSSSYSAEDFLWQLPKSLMVGLGSLLLSIAAMMVVFSATFFLVFHGRMPWVPILIAVISSMPVILFIRQLYRFFVNGCTFFWTKVLS